MQIPEIVRRIVEHGGIDSFDTVQVKLLRRGRKPYLSGQWQNVAVCKDGTRIGLSKEEEQDIMEWGRDLPRLVEERKRANDPDG